MQLSSAEHSQKLFEWCNQNPKVAPTEHLAEEPFPTLIYCSCGWEC